MVRGAKLRSFMSSIIRWRSGVMTCSCAEVKEWGGTLIMAQQERGMGTEGREDRRDREGVGQEGLGRRDSPRPARRLALWDSTAKRFSTTGIMSQPPGRQQGAKDSPGQRLMSN